MLENDNLHFILARFSSKSNLALNRSSWVVNMPQLRREGLRNE